MSAKPMLITLTVRDLWLAVWQIDARIDELEDELNRFVETDDEGEMISTRQKEQEELSAAKDRFRLAIALLQKATPET